MALGQRTPRFGLSRKALSYSLLECLQHFPLSLTEDSRRFYCPIDSDVAFKEDLCQSIQDNLMTSELPEQDSKGLL